MTQILREQHMRLFMALEECEDRLRSWSGASEANQRLFHENPAAALHAADLRLDRDAMIEFETVLQNLARKLKLGLPDPA